jgi:cytochrome P450 family 710 subfamily A protein
MLQTSFILTINCQLPTTLQINMEVDEAAAQGVPPPYYAENDKMADSVMDFLFASQDASTASLVWTLTLMAEHPDVLAKAC